MSSINMFEQALSIFVLLPKILPINRNTFMVAKCPIRWRLRKVVLDESRKISQYFNVLELCVVPVDVVYEIAGHQYVVDLKPLNSIQ